MASDSITPAVLYKRVSTDQQDRDCTIVGQDFACRQYCERNGLTIIAEFSDPAVSGTVPFSERPGGQQLLAFLDEHYPPAGKKKATGPKPITVVVYRLDRLAREQVGGIEAYKRLRRHAELKSVHETWDDSPSGRLMFSMFMSFAEYEREVITERLANGRHKAVRDGAYMTSRAAPYGYRRDGNQLAVYEPEAEVVRALFSLVAEGATCYTASQQLGLHDKQAWRYLKTRRFTGVVDYAGTEMHCPAIVSQDIFDQVQERLLENKRKGHSSHDYLLRGLIHCGYCGSPYSAFTQPNGTTYYCCWKRRKVRHGHDGVQWMWRSDVLVPLVMAKLRSMLRDPERTARECALRVQAIKDASAALPSRVAIADRRLVAAADERERVLDTWRRGVLPEKDMVALLEKISTEQKQARTDRADALEASARAETDISAAAWLAAALSGLSIGKAKGVARLVTELANAEVVGDPADLIGSRQVVIDIDQETGQTTVSAGEVDDATLLRKLVKRIVVRADGGLDFESPLVSLVPGSLKRPDHQCYATWTLAA